VDGRRGVPVLLALLLALVVAGCEGIAVEDIGGGVGRPPADLATGKAERAEWPDPPKDAVAAKVQRVSDGDTFVATVKGPSGTGPGDRGGHAGVGGAQPP
jgi:hypothetical protein